MNQLTGYDLFLEIVEKSFMGEDLFYSGIKYELSPYLVKKTDFTTPSETTPALFRNLKPSFKTTAQSELYRKGARKSWIEKGIHEKCIREVSIDGTNYILPRMNEKATIGIDGAGIRQDNWVFLFCVLEDASAAYTYLERHLKLPKRKKEFKFRHIKNQRVGYRKQLPLFLNLFCTDVLFFKTFLLKKHLPSYLKKIYKGKPTKLKLQQYEVIKTLLTEFFTGVPPEEITDREQLRKRLFEKFNGTRIDLDKGDFPIPEVKVLQILSMVLSKNKELGNLEIRFMNGLDSQCSKEIQMADLIAGCVSYDFRQGQTLLPVFKKLNFEHKLLSRWFNHQKNLVTFYYWGKDY